MLEHSQVKLVTDVLSVSTVFAAIAGLLPAIAAVFSIVWIGIQIFISWEKIKQAFVERFGKKIIDKDK